VALRREQVTGRYRWLVAQRVVSTVVVKSHCGALAEGFALPEGF
jgi:hypothetical protein